MTINIKFSPYALQNNETLMQRVQFVYSPLNELFRSLHVLLNPRHHGMHIAWALDAQQRLSDKLLNDLQYFSLLYELGVPPILLNNFESLAPNLDREIEQLKTYLSTIDPQAFLNSLKKVVAERKSNFIPTLGKSLEWQDFQPSHTPSLLKDLAADPPAVYQRLITFIQEYRQQVFDWTWNSKGLKQLLLNEIERQSLYLKRYGFIKLINNLQVDRISWREKELVIVKPFTQKIELTSQETIILLPSCFTWPHLFVDRFKHGIVLNYNASSKQQLTLGPSYLADVFNALSDVVRLKIIKLLADQPSTTQALGQILTMSNSTVSHHLKLLKTAGIVTTKKEGKFVLYEPAKMLTKLIPDFYTLIKDNKNWLK
ncbi:ArsR/SmtB family transcription factor [Liquorilactobacillus capillatus]|uniref:Transcriptional regulator n=1 Tax=Liquorilactobacillus capillatus DSM 19910 TaxID=1423731 RepID=A0A0R1M0L3_9LACO|nr:DUF5937 family protein [Liquorilactobacillus capillatus]KRL01145.1 transcriptional regulator [Liquorilactobacillus capillatus DSM 19910]